ncbi:hypothetical protein BJP62_10985 [Jeongeupia sp. USM3]|nr:hypothetical protein BJP62_10985 [Jeongeupia sp. USM3]
MGLGERYDFILLSAVWMHIPSPQRKLALRRLIQLLSDGGRLAMTLRLGEPSPERVMHTVSVEEILTLANELGLTIIYKSRINKDSLKRNSVAWRKIVLSTSLRV